MRYAPPLRPCLARRRGSATFTTTGRRAARSCLPRRCWSPCCRRLGRSGRAGSASPASRSATAGATRRSPATGSCRFTSSANGSPIRWSSRSQQAGLRVTELDGLTGLAEYRNGGLFLDCGVLEPLDPALLQRPFDPQSEPVVEWRALTVALLDRLASGVRERLGKSRGSSRSPACSKAAAGRPGGKSPSSADRTGPARHCPQRRHLVLGASDHAAGTGRV